MHQTYESDKIKHRQKYSNQLCDTKNQRKCD